METTTRPVGAKAIVLTLGFMISFGPLSIDMYLPALSRIAENLSADLGYVQLSLSAFFVGLALGQLFYGPFTDKVGRKKPLYIGLSIYTFASIICALAPNVEVLVGARFFQAIGSCAGVVISRAIVRDLYGAREAAKIYSLLMLIMGVAPIMAPMLGGYLSEAFGWRYIFLVLGVTSVLCLASIHFFLPETGKANPQAGKKIMSSYLEILTHRTFIRNATSGSFAQSAMFAYITGSSFVFIELFGVRAENFGYIFGSNALGLILCSQINARLLRKYNPSDILNKVFPVIALISVGIIILGIMATNLWMIWLPIFLFMSCLGMTFPNTSAEALSEEGESAGTASALLGCIQYSLAALISSLMSILHNGTIIPMVSVMAFCGVTSFSLYYFLRKEKDEEELQELSI